MSKDDDSLIDKNGIIYVRGWDGRYRQKNGIFGTERDVGILGGPRAEIGFMGDQLIARDSSGNPIYSNDGEQLYRRSGSRNPSAGDPISDLLANSGEHGFAVVFILFLILSVILGTVLKFLIGAIAFIGPILFGGWLYFSGWAKRSRWLKWLGASSWFVAGFIINAIMGNDAIAGEFGNYAWLAYVYHAVGVIAVAIIAITGIKSKGGDKGKSISPPLKQIAPDPPSPHNDQASTETQAPVVLRPKPAQTASQLPNALIIAVVGLLGAIPCSCCVMYIGLNLLFAFSQTR